MHADPSKAHCCFGERGGAGKRGWLTPRTAEIPPPVPPFIDCDVVVRSVAETPDFWHRRRISALTRRYDQLNSFNKLSPFHGRSSLFSLGLTSVSLFRVCAPERGAYVCAFSYLWAIPHRAFSAGEDVLVWVMEVGLALSKTLQPPRVSSTVLKLRCKTGWFA